MKKVEVLKESYLYGSSHHTQVHLTGKWKIIRQSNGKSDLYLEIEGKPKQELTEVTYTHRYKKRLWPEFWKTEERKEEEVKKELVYVDTTKWVHSELLSIKEYDLFINDCNTKEEKDE